MRKNRIAAALISICLIAGLSGCGEKMEEGAALLPGASGGSSEVHDGISGSLKAESGSSGAALMNGTATVGSSAEGTAETKGDDGGESYDMPFEMPGAAESSKEDSAMEPAGGDMAVEPIMEEPDFIEVETEKFDEQVPPRAGLLTAGEWRDNENWGFFTNLVHTGRFAFRQFGVAPYQRVVVQALSEGAPVAKVKVQLCNVTGSAIATAVTDHNGKAYLYYNRYGGEEMADYVVLEKPDGSKVIERLAEAGQNAGNEADGGLEASENAAESPSVQQTDERQQGQGFTELITSTELTVELGSMEVPVRALDVMFVFDTTGSMGDELMYLQKEFEDIAGRVADQSTRFSVNFYRDKGDVYVVRSNPFLDDIKAVSALINAESADGGGDYEEAVDEALFDAVMNHDWRENAVKLMFLILDAPPHDTQETAANVKSAVDAAMEQGIRIIPIASSGVNEETEGFLRSLAMLTGGTYTFLTDDSGIGGSHLEPTIGAYTVEALNELIVRLVKEYYGE